MATSLSVTDPRYIALTNQTLRPIVLFDFDIGDTTYRRTVGPSDVTIGSDTYYKTKDVFSTTLPEQSEDYAQDLWTIELSEPNISAEHTQMKSFKLGNRRKNNNDVRFTNNDGLVSVDGTRFVPSNWMQNNQNDVIIRTVGVRRLGTQMLLAFETEGESIVVGPHFKQEILNDLRITLVSGSRTVVATGIDDPLEPYFFTIDDPTQGLDFYTNQTEPNGLLTIDYRPESWFNRMRAVGQGRVKLRVRIGFLNDDGTTQTELYSVWNGTASNISQTYDPDGLKTRVQFTGPLARVDNEFARYTTRESQRQADEDDTAFDFAHRTNNSVAWGGRRDRRR